MIDDKRISRHLPQGVIFLSYLFIILFVYGCSKNNSVSATDLERYLQAHPVRYELPPNAGSVTYAEELERRMERVKNEEAIRYWIYFDDVRNGSLSEEALAEEAEAERLRLQALGFQDIQEEKQFFFGTATKQLLKSFDASENYRYIIGTF